MKSMYRYKFRSLTDPPEFYELEAGPFEPFAAGIFGQTEAGNKAMQTGRRGCVTWKPIKTELAKIDSPRSRAYS